MVMAVKYQLTMSHDPRDLVFVTLNHLDAIMDYATTPAVKKNVELAYELLIQSYCPLSLDEMRAIRYSMLNFLKDVKIRVSIFLQEKKQNLDGSFVTQQPNIVPRGMSSIAGLLSAGINSYWTKIKNILQ